MAGHRGEVRVVALAEGEDGPGWRRALESCDLSRARVLKEEDGQGVWAVEFGGRACVVKVWEHRSAWERVKASLRASRAWRHWRGAAWLTKNGFDTARVLVLGREDGGGAAREWLVMERLEGKTVLEILEGGGLTVREEHGLAASLAEGISDMVARGRFNRDHKPSNLIMTGWREQGVARLAVIDCVAIRKCRRFDFGAMRRMLASLYIEPLGVGSPPRRTLCMRALRSISARGWWEEIGRAIVEHGDPRPRVRPGAGSGG